MRRTPIAHVIFPRFDVVRPVPEFAWEAARALLETDDLDVEVLLERHDEPLPEREVSAAEGIGEDRVDHEVIGLIVPAGVGRAGDQGEREDRPCAPKERL